MGTAIRHRCDDCRATDAVFEAQQRRVRPGDTKETKGISAPWERRFLCEPCAKAAALSDDPPRKVTPLAGYKPPAPEAPPASENLQLGDDWGIRS